MVANSFPHIDLNSTEDAPVDVPFDRNAHEASHVQAAHASAPDRDAAQGLTAVIKSVKELLTTPATVPVTGVNSGSNGASSRLLSPNGVLSRRLNLLWVAIRATIQGKASKAPRPRESTALSRGVGLLVQRSRTLVEGRRLLTPASRRCRRAPPTPLCL